MELRSGSTATSAAVGRAPPSSCPPPRARPSPRARRSRSGARGSRYARSATRCAHELEPMTTLTGLLFGRGAPRLLSGWRAARGRDGPRRGCTRSRCCRCPHGSRARRMEGCTAARRRAHRGDGRCCIRPEVHAAVRPAAADAPGLSDEYRGPAVSPGAAGVEGGRARARRACPHRGTSRALWGRGRGFALHAAGHAFALLGAVSVMFLCAQGCGWSRRHPRVTTYTAVTVSCG